MQNSTTHYVTLFERMKNQLPGQQMATLQGNRQAALDYFSQLGFPTRKLEEWKYTPLNVIANHSFTTTTDPSSVINENQLKSWQISGLDCYQLVLVNGVYCAALSYVDDLKFDTLAHCATKENFSAWEIESQTDAFTALNTAFMRDGIVLTIEKNRVLKKPLHIIHLTTQIDLMTNTRNLIRFEAGSCATVIESFVGDNDLLYLTNNVTEITLAAQAQCDHYKIHRQGSKAQHVDRLVVKQVSGSRFDGYTFSLAGELVRSETVVECGGSPSSQVPFPSPTCGRGARGEGEQPHSLSPNSSPVNGRGEYNSGTTCNLYGLNIAQHQQHIEQRTTLHHAIERGQSRQFYKGIVNHQAHAVFNGRVVVEKGAVKTDAKQYNKNLLLSNTAQVTTKPQLEIFADDVKCAHGATVGQLDEQALFFLQARGLSNQDAQRLLIHGFVCDIIEKINLIHAKQHIENLLEELSWSQR